MSHSSKGEINIFREGEFIVIIAPARGQPGQFTFEGVTYVYGVNGVPVWAIKDAFGFGWTRAANIRWIQWEPDPIRDQLTIPDKLAGRSAAVLPMMKTGTTRSARGPSRSTACAMVCNTLTRASNRATCANSCAKILLRWALSVDLVKLAGR